MTTSTVNPSNPLTASPLASSVIRANFLAAYNDINAIFQQFTALGGQLWATSGAPAATLGHNGDYALDATAGELYGPKSGGAWPTAPVSLGGSAGYIPATGGSVAFANSAALPAFAYANGTAGVGATITATANGALSSTVCDGVTPTVGMRCWIWDYTQAAGGNLAYGLYTVTQVGSASTPFILTRATDANTAALLGKLLAFVIGVTASVNAGKTIAVPLASTQITVGTTALNPTVIGGPGGVQQETQRALAAEAGIPGIVRAQRLVNDVVKAAGTPGAVSLLVTGDGTKTYRPGTTVGEIQTLAPLIGPANLGQQPNAWSPGDYSIATGGLPVMPVQNADGSLKFHSQTGFRLNAAPMSQMSVFSLDMIVSFPPVAATFATKALATADTTLFTDAILATSGEGFIVPISPSADLPLLKYRANGTYSAAQMLDGLYLKQYNTGPIVAENYLLYIAGPSSTFFGFVMDQRGQIIVGGLDVPGNQPSMQSYCYNAYATGAKIHIHIASDGKNFSMWVNGMNLFTHTTQFIVSPTVLCLNGNGGGNTLNPVNGWPCSIHALCITEHLLFPAHRAVHDVIASAYGTRPMDWSPKMFGRIFMGQSQEEGSTDASSDTGNNPDSDNHWGGILYTPNQQYGSYASTFTQTPLPRNYFFNAANNPLTIGPIDLSLNVYGIPICTHCQAGGQAVETQEWGFDHWIRQIPEFATSDIISFGPCFGAYSFDLLTGRSIPPLFPPQLRDYDTATIAQGVPGHTAQYFAPLDLMERQLLAAMDFAHSRGQIFEVAIFEYSQGETRTTETTNYGSELVQFFKSEIANIMALTGQTRVPICFTKEICLKGGGLDNYMMDGPYYYQNQRRVITPDANPNVSSGGPGVPGGNVITAGPNSVNLSIYNGLCDYADGGAWIHKPSITYRKRGERHGYFFYQLMTGNIPRGLIVIGLAVATAATANINVGDLVLSLNQAAQFVVTQQPNVTRTIITPPTGGTPVSTYGLVLIPAPSSPSATIASVFFKTGDATTLVVRLSRPAIATSGPTVGDAITATGGGAMFTNIKATATITGFYYDEDWVYALANLTTINSYPGLAPFRESLTALNDLTPFLASGLYQF